MSTAEDKVKTRDQLFIRHISVLEFVFVHYMVGSRVIPPRELKAVDAATQVYQVAECLHSLFLFLQACTRPHGPAGPFRGTNIEVKTLSSCLFFIQHGFKPSFSSVFIQLHIDVFLV